MFVAGQTELGITQRPLNEGILALSIVRQERLRHFSERLFNGSRESVREPMKYVNQYLLIIIILE